jgi:predicted amidophosphoribosyltransferase
MSQVSEIKCPVCGKWSKWTGKIDEQCPHCNAHYDPARLQYAEEKRINAEVARKNGYLVIADTDDPVVQMLKQFANWMMWTTYYGISVIYFVIAILVVLYGLVML